MIPALVQLLDELAASAPGVQTSTAAGVISWSRAGSVFGAAGPGGIELRLEPAIAAAAARTPDAGSSTRGPEWVRFNPRQLDGHAADRVEAWFELAYRLAAP